GSRHDRFSLPLSIARARSEADHEPVVGSHVARIAAVPARDLAHQRQPQSGPGIVRGPREPVKWAEDALALGLGDPGPVIAHAQLRAAAFGAAHAHLEWRRAVSPRVLQEIADHPA